MIANYITDFRKNWRPLLSACLGLSGGMALAPFSTSILAPHLIHDLGWSKADFALLAVVSGLGIVTMPIVGRMADMFGVKRVAAVGIVASALSYLLLSVLNGSLMQYVGIMVMQISFGAATTGIVYLRLIVQNFDRTRGVALAIAVSTAPFIAAVGSPVLSAIIEVSSWRTGCLVLAAYAAGAGALALLLAPGDRALNRSAAKPKGPASTGARALLSRSTFWLLITATILFNMPNVVAHSQLVLVLVENGMDAVAAASFVSLYAVGVIAGRFSAGAALDRFPAEIVGAIALSLPGFGMFLLASPMDQPLVLAVAILLVGLASGAEGDLLAFLAVKHFGLEHYSTALGFFFAAVGAATMLGGAVLSASLRLGGSYPVFLSIAGVCVFLGCAMLLASRSASGWSSDTHVNEAILGARNPVE